MSKPFRRAGSARFRAIALGCVGTIVGALLLGCGGGSQEMQNAASDDSGASESGEMGSRLPYLDDGLCDSGMERWPGGMCAYACIAQSDCEAGEECQDNGPTEAGEELGQCVVPCESGCTCADGLCMLDSMICVGEGAWSAEWGATLNTDNEPIDSSACE